MKITIDYLKEKNCAIITSDSPTSNEWSTTCTTICCLLRDNAQFIGLILILPWQMYLAYKNYLNYDFNNAEFILTSKAEEMVFESKDVEYYSVINKEPIDSGDLLAVLKKKGFKRELTKEQIRNICKLASLPAGASFSVPGAGKTTEALAYFTYHAHENDKLLVVAPKNAFGAWDEQLDQCLTLQSNFIRLRGGYDRIESILSSNPQFVIISYQQYPKVENLLRDYLSSNRVFMFLDESHKIKSGSRGVIADSLLQSSYLPYRKLILSGTPAPQSLNDFDPQLAFLYPDISLESSFGDTTAVEKIQPIFVRTTKAELGLPKPIIKEIDLHLTPKQQFFYGLLRSATARSLNSISHHDKSSMRKIGGSIMKLMQYVSNPSLLAQDLSYSFSDELSEALTSGESVKIDYACNRARELAGAGQKTIIWSSFVQNVEIISRRLADIGADYIHGQVDAGSEDDEDTREGKIKRFHEDPNSMVLVANPAAAAEGISLHTVCHTAIYVDRNFNAAQYLQSLDRIHRLGLPQGIETHIEILQCKDTIDQLISARLNEKVTRMAKVLNDPSLNIEPVEYIEDDESFTGIDQSDIKEILSYLNEA